MGLLWFKEFSLESQVNLLVEEKCTKLFPHNSEKENADTVDTVYL